MITTERGFNPSTRYTYDFGRCSYENGFAQLDTSQDASYFGQWINPTTREVFCYCEGDTYITRAETDAELVQVVREIKEWNEQQGHRYLGIDPGIGENDLKARLVAAGLEAFLHPVYEAVS